MEERERVVSRKGRREREGEKGGAKKGEKKKEIEKEGKIGKEFNECE